jgi:DNA-binding NtrC family response regulator
VEADRDEEDINWDRVRNRIEAQMPLVRLALERALLHQRVHRSTEKDDPIYAEGLVTESDAMQSVVRQVQHLASSAHPVLLTGESGVGKCLLARALHAASPRSDGPLRHVACATMQQEPIAEQLFGTLTDDGSVADGAVHEADGGTLLIEDIDALPLSAQSTLLHLLTTGRVVPEGGTDAVPADVRVVATTSERLDEQVRNDHFRPALRERLHALSLHVPPLRKRRADIPLLVRHFLNTLPTDPSQGPRPSITQPAMEALLRYDWPGNVRQLRNELERALVHVASEPDRTIDRDVLLDTIVEDAQSAGSPPGDERDAILHPNQSLDDVLARTEATVIKRVLQACEGQVTASAEVLGLSRQGLYKKMKRLGIDASDFQPESDPTPVSS